MSPILAPAVLAVILAAPSATPVHFPVLPGTRPAPAAPAPAPVAAPATAPAAPRPAKAQNPFLFTAAFGGDFGFTDLFTVPMEDGSSRSLTANQGVFLSVGAGYRWPVADGKLETEARVGIKYTSITASNGGVDLVTFPMELLQAVRLDPIRLAAGVLYLPPASASGDGVVSDFSQKYDGSLGVVLQGEWVFGLGGKSRWGLGPRFIWQKIQVRDDELVSANALGFLVTLAL